MRDLRVGTPVITVKPYTEEGGISISKGRIGLVSNFVRNPKNDAIEIMDVNFGLTKEGKPLVVNVLDIQAVKRFSVVEKQEKDEISSKV